MQLIEAIVRMAKDRRILMRNKAEIWPEQNMSGLDLELRTVKDLNGFKWRLTSAW